MEVVTLKLEDLDVYNMALSIGEDVWKAVAPWSYFDKDTVGKQLIRSADSFAANIAEGYGRFHYKENRLFCYYSRGSMMETRTWLSKARARNLISDKMYAELSARLDNLHLKLNAYIKSIGSHS